MGKKLVSVFPMLFVAVFLAHSQDTYLLKYKSPDVKDTVTYQAFFSLAANGNGFVRVKPFYKKELVFEMTFEEQYAMGKNGIADPNYLLYEGKIAATNPKVNTTPVTFWFKINADNLYDPWAVTSVSVNAAPAEKNLTFEYIESNNLTQKKELVSGFFEVTSDYYKKLFPGTKGIEKLSNDELRDTYAYLVVVASTNDKNIGAGCLIDARKVINKFNEIFINSLHLRHVKIDSIFGNNYSKENVEAALEKIKPNKNNIIIFYYSGHGFHDNDKDYDKKIFPFFDLRDPAKQLFYADLKTKRLNVEDIYNKILQKKARFNLVLSDCCNDTVKKPVIAPKQTGIQPPGHKGVDKISFANAKTLFMDSTKTVNLLMTAAKKGEEAIVTPSFQSYFTFFFLQSLDTYLSPQLVTTPVWTQILSSASSSTMKQVRVLCNGEINCPHKQTPVSVSKFQLPGIK
jgi:hypothetical protein